MEKFSEAYRKEIVKTLVLSINDLEASRNKSVVPLERQEETMRNIIDTCDDDKIWEVIEQYVPAISGRTVVRPD
jgi:hypothetical protein